MTGSITLSISSLALFVHQATRYGTPPCFIKPALRRCARVFAVKPPTLTYQTHHTISDELRTAAIDLWVAGNDANGAVGFLPGASWDAVAEVFDSYLPKLESNNATLVTGCVQESNGASSQAARIDAMAFLTQDSLLPDRPDFSVLVGIGRLVLHPRLWGHGLGVQFMERLHDYAAELPHAAHTQVMYRAGHGLGRFYSKLGYTQVGWLPDVMTIPTPDGGLEWRAAAIAMRRLDGQPYDQDFLNAPTP